jgi:hypothetical protein
MDNNTEIEEQRQRVFDENRGFQTNASTPKTKTEGFQTSARNGSGLLFPIVIVGLVGRLLDGNQLNLWAVIGLVCVGLWISFANTATRT